MFKFFLIFFVFFSFGSLERNCDAAAGVKPSPSVPVLESPAQDSAALIGKLVWEELRPGLELTTLVNSGPSKEQITILRINPAYYHFQLLSAVWDGEHPMTLAQWVEKYDLVAAINACMYLPDGLTATAYIRRGAQTNNRGVAERYGGFFVCNPRDSALAPAAILDKNAVDWERLLPKYDVVVQNMRLLGTDGSQLWPENGPLHAVAAIGQDADGNILFLHCRTQVNVHKLVQILLANRGLNLVSAVYVEGGSQSAMALRLPERTQFWTGRRSVDFLWPSFLYPLPNIIGIRPR